MGYGPPAPVEVFQHEAEFLELLELYRERKPKRVLEIGTYHGGTLYHWLQNATKGTVVVSVDSYAVGVDNRHLYKSWCPKGVTVYAINGDSHDDLVQTLSVTDKPFDWVFIDADHYYEPVKQDWDWARKIVAADGVVVFHDILTSDYHPEIEVQQLWDEIKADGYDTREIIESPDAPWGGLGVVFLDGRVDREGDVLH